MKFEQYLKIYWSRNFLYGGKTQPFQVTFTEFFIDKSGLKTKSIKLFYKRFEIKHLILLKNSEILFSKEFSLSQRKVFNYYLSKLTSINNEIFELQKFNQIRSYLIKTYHGRRLSLNKPSRGQRTWSNASTAKICNIHIKNFINNVKRLNAHRIKKVKESLNKKFFKKKIKQKTPKLKMIFTKKKKNIWF